MLTAILMGAGDRGRVAYGSWVIKNPKRLNFVAVAEPRYSRLEKFAKEHNIPPENCFSSWEDLIAKGKIADICFVTTQDQMHTEPVIKALELGYHVLVEKPMATDIDECYKMINVAEKEKRQLWIAHVLRYTPFFSKIKQVIEEGTIGKVININHSENISYWHYSHSYVRGNWRREEDSSPIILAKTCHDLDILYWLADSPVKNISSFGDLSFYHKGNAPKNAPRYCLDGCPQKDTCQWYAPRIYIKAEPLLQVGLRAHANYKKFLAKSALHYPAVIRTLSKLYSPLDTLVNWSVWPVSAITDDYSRENVLEVLQKGPFGRCVFHCDNNVCDNQVVNIEFENQVKATLTLHGLSAFEGRFIRIDGSNGTLFGKFTAERQEIDYYNHRDAKKRTLLQEDLRLDGHGGGDSGIMNKMIDTVERELKRREKIKVLTSAKESLESHLMAFAAEKSRLEKRIVSLDELRK